MRILFPYMARWRTRTYSRYHALLKAFADMGHEVFVIEPPRRPSQEINWSEGEEGDHPGIHVVEAAMPRYWYWRVPFEKLWAKGLYSLLVEGTVRSVVRSEGIELMILYNLPQRRLLRRRECLAVFDVCDDLPDMLASELPVPGAREMADRALRAMAGEADRVTVTSQALLGLVGAPAALVPNGADFPERLPERDRDGPVVYLGAFEYFVDFELLFAAARRLPGRRFALVGGGRREAWVLEQARSLRNVEVLPVVPHHIISALLRTYSTGVVPFRPTAVGYGASPLKAYEYLSAGLPVVSTPILDVERANGEAGAPLIRVAGGSREFAEAVEESAGADIDAEAWRRLAIARSWRNLARRFLESLGLARGDAHKAASAGG